MVKGLGQKTTISLLSISAKNRTILAAGIVFVLALAIRLIYIKQLSHTYFFAPFQGGYDDYIFDHWAQEIVNGNWLGDKTIYIYRMPLYAYFLAFVYFLAGHSYWAVYVTQSVIGASACVLVFWIGKLLGNRMVGFIAGLFNAFCGNFIFYNGMLVGEPLSVFFLCASFLLLTLFQRSSNVDILFSAGLFFGISVLARANMLVMLPFVLLWIFMRGKKAALKKAFFYCAVMIAGVILALLPIFIRNYVNERDVVPSIAANAGMNFYIGNAYGANGKLRPVEGLGLNAEQMLWNSIRIAEERTGRMLKPSEVSNYWFGQTLESIRDHGAKFLVPLYVKKFVLFWNSYEVSDIWDYSFFTKYIPLLKVPLVTFGFVMPLAFLGMYLGMSRGRDLSLLYTFTFGYMVSLLLAVINARYRMPVFPFLSLFAAYAIVFVKDSVKGNFSKIVVCSTILLVAIVLCHIPVERVSLETSHNSLGVLLKRDGKIDEAIGEYNEALKIAPGYPSPYYNLGILYRDTGQPAEAIKYFKKAVELDPAGATPAREKLEELLK